MDAYLFLQEDMSAPRAVTLAAGEARVFCHRAPGKESANEDAAALFSLDDGCAVLAVADGVGGYRGADQASGLALHTLERELEAVERDGRDVREAILNALEAANREVVKLALGAGTTIVLAEVRDGRARAYHVGDSQALMTGQRGRLKLLTTAHSPTGYALEAGVLEEEEALRHEHRHLLSNMIGSEDMRIEMGSSVQVSPRDTLVLGTDGLFDNLRVDEIVELVRRGPSEEAARRLVEACRSRMAVEDDPEHPSKPDDLTAVVFRPGRR